MTDSFDYLERRVAPQRKWHAAKAKQSKQHYYATEIATLLAGAAIPVVNLVSISPHRAALLSALLGGVVVLATAIGKLCKFQESWLQYRALVETLDREVKIYRSGAGDYARIAPSERNRLLV